MALSLDVILPAAQAPAFPDRCVRCAHSAPGAAWTLHTRRMGWRSLTVGLGPRVSVTVPTCAPCREVLVHTRRWRGVWNWLWVGIAVAVGFLVSGGFETPGRYWVLALSVLVGVVPMSVWEVFNPPAFDLTATPKQVTFEFRDADYAEAFAELNGAEVE